MSLLAAPARDEASDDGLWRVSVPPISFADRMHADDHLLLWQVRGSSRIVLDGVVYPLANDHALWVPADTVHSGTLHANSVMLPIFFEVADHSTSLRRPALVPVDRSLHTLLLAQLQAQNTMLKPPVDLARQILTIIETVGALTSSLLLPTSGPAAAVADALRANPGDDRRVEELAASAHASVRTIERAFRAETGMPWRAWRVRNRMEAAAALLASTPVEIVAHRVGYTNASAFRRAFKAHFDVSPSAYAARFGPRR